MRKHGSICYQNTTNFEPWYYWWGGDDDANAQINYSVMQVYPAQLSDYLVEQMPDLTMM